MTWAWLLVPIAYVLGSVSFAFLAGRLKGIDLREHGSKNLGATNAGRVLGRPWFFAVFTLDLLKGLGAVMAGQWLAPHGDRPRLPPGGGAAAEPRPPLPWLPPLKGGE